jgi:hypothetical protein
VLFYFYQSDNFSNILFSFLSSVRSSHYWFTKLHGGGVAVWKHLPVAAHHDRTAQGQGSLLLATGVPRLDYGAAQDFFALQLHSGA